MKRFILRLIGVMPAALAVLLLGGCNEDVMQSRVLSGKWHGDWGMYYVYRYHGCDYTFECHDTRIEFWPDHAWAAHGEGRQIDYYDYGPYEYQYYYFQWSIHNGIVNLYYPHDLELNTAISEYHMNNHVFTGYFINANEPFYLRKWSDYFDWSGFRGNYCFGWRNDFVFPRYAPQTEGTDSIVPPTHVSPNEGQIILRGNRFSKGASSL